MASLKDIRIRIASVKSTRKITSAMKVVSAAKFHKAQESQHHFQRYLDEFQYTMALAARKSTTYTHPLMETHNPDAPVALLLFASNSSLCGAYNQNAINLAIRTATRLRDEGKQVKIYAFGKRAIDGIRNAKFQPVYMDDRLVEKPVLSEVSTVFEKIADSFLSGKLSRVLVVYNKFQNAATQHPTLDDLLPVSTELNVRIDPTLEYIIEPTPKEFFEFALPHFAKLKLFTYVLQNYVGEHGARMTAMTQATDNANNLVGDLTLEYNKLRQAAITNEILEIVSGADALKSST